MSIPQVGQGAVAVVPTFKGFRKSTDAQMSGAVKSASGIFGTGFRAAGSDSGKGFAASFNTATKNISSAPLKALSADVARSSREVSAARLKEQDAAGKVRLAEAQLGEARSRYADGSSQLIRAEERLATAQRNATTVKSALVGSTEKLAAAQRSLASATAQANTSGQQSGGIFTRLRNLFGTSGGESASRFGASFKSSIGQIFAGNILADAVGQAAFSVGRTAAQAVQSGVAYAFQSVNLASALEQSQGAVSAVFKEQAEPIVSFASRAATTVGLARAKYLAFATVVGAQLKNLGVPFDQVSGKTNDLIELGADLAAQFGGETSDAVAALSSLLRGERDPIERYGVGIKQVDVDARVAAMGLGEMTAEQQKQAEIQATLALLWDQTADAQGMFFREQDTYAGKQQRLNAQLEEAQTKFGEALLPTATDVLQFANDELLPVLQSTLSQIGPEVAQTLRDSAPEIKDAITAIAASVPDAIDLAGTVLPLITASVEGDAKFFGDAQDTFEMVDGFFTEYLPRWAEGSVSVEESWDGFFNWWDLAWDGTADTTKNKSDEIKDYWLTSLAALKAETEKLTLENEGYAFAQGFADGIETGTEKVVLASEQMALAARDKTRNTLQIKSPSRVGREDGRHYPEGWALGILDGIPEIESAAASMAAVARVGEGQSASIEGGAGVAGTFPSTVTLVDASGALLGHMDVRIGEYDRQVSSTLARGVRRT